MILKIVLHTKITQANLLKKIHFCRHRSPSPTPSYWGCPLHRQHLFGSEQREGEPGMVFALDSLMGNLRAPLSPGGLPAIPPRTCEAWLDE